VSSEQSAGAVAGRPPARPASDDAGAARDGVRGWLKRRPEWTARRLGFVARWLRDPIAPVIALCAILVVSLGLRVYSIEQPCTSPCKTPTSHTLIFDEAYYVNAARIIDHIEPPTGEDYHGAPLGKDPNAEHPQLAKLIIAGSIELFGDNGFGWRLGSVLFGLIALIALYTLVRAAGGSGWLATGVAAVAAVDNLMLVHSRIGTLDIYAIAMMLISATLYLRRHPIWAGVALGIAMCMKEVAIYMVAVYVLFELGRWLRAWWTDSGSGWLRENVRPAAFVVFSGAASFLLLLWILDMLVPAYDTGTHITYAGSPFTHFFHMVHYATLLKSEPARPGISSTPFQWLLNEKAIPYAKTAVTSTSGGKIVANHPQYFFQGLINPYIIFLAIPALAACLSIWWRKGETLSLLAVAWFIGCFVPAIFESYALRRVNYIYYMLIVMPAIYIALARVFGDRRVPKVATVAWAVMLVFGFIDLYPIRVLPFGI
jgi:4-amino-4-deoxy-L-arabinose transferase-like glycosyltransferase